VRELAVMMQNDEAAPMEDFGVAAMEIEAARFRRRGEDWWRDNARGAAAGQ
jgi:hypothetical protein